MKRDQLTEELDPRQYEDIYHEYDEPFSSGEGSIMRRLLYFGITLLLIILLLSIVIKIPREINVEFELRGGSKEIVAQFPDEIYVKDQLVRTDQYVAAGDLIMTIYSERIVRFIEEITVLESDIAFHEEALKQGFNAEQTLLLEQKKHAQRSIHLLSQKVRTYSRQYDSLSLNMKEQAGLQKKDFERNRSLYRTGAISDRDLEQSEQELKALEQQLSGSLDILEARITNFQRARNEEIRTIARIDRQLDADRINQENELLDLKRRLELVYEKLALNYGKCEVNDRYLNLLSPEAGTITLASTNELAVPPNRILWRLQTEKEPFNAYAEGNSSQIGSLALRQPVVLKVESFPHYYYGTLKGQITQLSRSPNIDGSYPLSIQLGEYGKLAGKLTKGMQGTATVIVEEKTMLEYLLMSLLKATSID